MNKKDWANIIGISVSCFEIMDQNRLSSGEYKELLDLFDNNTELFIEIMKSGKYNFTQILTIMFDIAFDKREINNLKDEDKSIYDMGMQDIYVWAKDCFVKHGYYGLSEEHFGWIIKLINKGVFRLGRLEFEPYIINEDVKLADSFLPKGTKTLKVHIPGGVPLIHEECIKSYELAKKFFKYEKHVFICESWLLSPLLEEMLPKTSNILKFKNDYEIYKTDLINRLFEERIFGGVIYDNPNMYVAKTGLQKKAKEILRSGKELVGAWGVLKHNG